MSVFKNTDALSSKPKMPRLRTARGSNAITQIAISAASGNTILAVSTTANIVVGQIIVAPANTVSLSGATRGYNTYAPNVANVATAVVSINVAANTVTVSNALIGIIGANTVINLDTPVGLRYGGYAANTVLVTPSRLTPANTLFANNATTRINPVAHTGWVHVRTGTGGRAGRVQTEVLVAMSNSVASNASSGGTYFANT